MKIWHLGFASDGRHPLFPTEEVRRKALLVLVRHAGPWLIAFCVVDDHLHVLVVCSRERAGKLRRAIVMGLRPVAGLGFEDTYIKPVETRAHLKSLVAYCIEQPKRYGLGVPSAVWSGSCFSELVGARRIDGLLLRVAEVLPRYRVADAWLAADVRGGIPPVPEERLPGIALTALRGAASFATCAHPRLVGRSKRETDARAEVVQLGKPAGFRKDVIASFLGISGEAVRLLGHRSLDEGLLSATRLRLAIVEAVGGAKLSDR